MRRLPIDPKPITRSCLAVLFIRGSCRIVGCLTAIRGPMIISDQALYRAASGGQVEDAGHDWGATSHRGRTLKKPGSSLARLIVKSLMVRLQTVPLGPTRMPELTRSEE